MTVKSLNKKQNKAKHQAEVNTDDLHTTSATQNHEGLPAGWKWVKVSELADVVRGGSPRPAGDLKYYDGSIPFLKVRDITKDNGKYLDSFEYTIKEAGLHKTRQIKPGTLLLSNSGATLGVPKICRIAATMNDGIAAFLNLDRRSNLYLYYFWLSKTRELRNINMGAAQPNLNTDIIKNYEVPYCSFEEQHTIVSKIEELLSELDKGKQQLETAQQQLRIYRQAVLKAAFEGRFTENWRSNNKETSTKKDIDVMREIGKNAKIILKYSKIEDTSILPRIPSSWIWIRNEELIHYVTSGSRDWKQYYSERGSYFIRTQDLNTNKLDLSHAAFVDLPSKVEGKRSLVERGDILMTITGANVGKVAYVESKISEAYVSQSVALMKYIDKDIVKYLWYYFQCKDFGQGLISGLVYGVGRPVLSLENMKEVPIAFCSKEEQQLIVQEIESRLSVCDKVEETINQSLAQAETLRQSILKKAFEGKLT